jgi:pimeloyl-ACP methyl ester carboxylesterase
MQNEKRASSLGDTHQAWSWQHQSPRFLRQEIVTRALDGCFSWIILLKLEDQLAKVRVSTLVIAGGKDIVPLDMAKRTAGVVKWCQLNVFEDNSHAPFVDSSERFVQLLTDFIKRVS